MRNLIFLLLTLVSLSCKDLGIPPTGQASGSVLFETEYVNWAWGYMYKGTVVFENGSLYAYDPGKDSVVVLYHADDRYTESELTAKYAHRKMYIRTIASDTLLLTRRLASEVTSGNFSDTLRVGADMGSVQYSMYQFHAESAQFRKLVLRVDGDWAFYDRSDAAVALAGLMKML